MARRPLIWQLFPTYLLVTLASLLAVTLYASAAMKRLYLQQLALDLEARARLIERHFEAGGIDFDRSSPAEVQAMCDALRPLAGSRITAIRADGAVLGDSDHDPAAMENHAARPEVAAALRGESGADTRSSRTMREPMMYVAVPLRRGGAAQGVVRAAFAVSPVDRSLWAIYSRIGIVGSVVALLAAAVSWSVSRRILRPLDAIKRGAERFAQGHLDQRLPIPDSLEIASLSEAMNKMAAQLDDRIRRAVQQRNEQEAVLSSMVESVIAVDRGERIITFNYAAGDLLGVDAENTTGRPLDEVVHHAALRAVVAQALGSEKPIEGEIVLEEPDGRILQAHGTTLEDAEGHAIGAVVVLNDITRLRRLERVRRDFVANVSHELKTPITSIKGFVETLIDGAMQDPEDARRFLDIVARQADRLHAIIEDLLTLSRIEQEEERAENLLAPGRLCGVIEAAVLLCNPAAKAKNIRIEAQCDEALWANINPALLEQGVVNLVDNAVKYSEPDRAVRVEALRTEREVIVRVADQGPGIPRDQLPRLFERFYRVDKARSRRLGGTGLGLSIVKHIATTHGGRVSVQSEVGQGSTFTIHLPRPADAA